MNQSPVMAERMRQTKNRILQTAKDIFLEQGCRRTTIRQIVERSGITSGSIYNIFSSKEEIFNTLAGDVLENCIRMVQKEAGKRLCAEMGTRDTGAVTAAVRYYAEPKLLFNVSRGSFMPAPNVDSCVIRLDVKKEPAVKTEDEQFYFRVVRGAFSQRRKNMCNSLSSAMGIPKSEVAEAIRAAGLPESVRPEQVQLEDFAKIADMLKKLSE